MEEKKDIVILGIESSCDETAASVVKNLDIKDFVPWIDINGLEPGTHEVSLHVKDVEGVTVGATTKLKITLKENN